MIYNTRQSTRLNLSSARFSSLITKFTLKVVRQMRPQVEGRFDQ